MKRVATSKLKRLQMIPRRRDTHRCTFHPVPGHGRGEFIHHRIHWLRLQSSLGDLPERLTSIL